jgi:predicted RNA-binding Zn-ribbon protein involved in translation (DUF1610 family)
MSHRFTRTEPNAVAHPTATCRSCGRSLVAQPQYRRWVCPAVGSRGAAHDAIPEETR